MVSINQLARRCSHVALAGLIAVAGIGIVAHVPAQATESQTSAAEQRVQDARDALASGQDANVALNEARAPYVRTLPDGRMVQRTPYDATSYYGEVVPAHNNLYLNADARGCTACHTIDSVYAGIDKLHAFCSGYGQEATPEGCFVCHVDPSYSMTPVPFKDVMHSIHFGSAMFDAMNGNCESCHYIMDDGTMALWDRVKYDYLTGITRIDAEDANLDFSWNQDEVTAREDMWFKGTHSSVESDWGFDTSIVSDEVSSNWIVSIDGDVENPIELTIPELVEMFGYEDALMPFACGEYGSGDPFIAQAQVRGISISKIIEYVQPHDDVNLLSIIGDDGYCYPIDPQTALRDGGLLVYQMNGETLYPEQGYPLRYMCYNLSAGNMSKRVCEIALTAEESPYYVEVVGEHGSNNPNVSVLNSLDGQVYEAGEAPVFAGCAYGFSDKIVSIEFSFDHGTSWTSYPLEGTTSEQWAWWEVDLGEAFDAPGSYLMEVRATSESADGQQYVSRPTAHLFTLRDDL